jgi:hypothetical protein
VLGYHALHDSHATRRRDAAPPHNPDTHARCISLVCLSICLFVHLYLCLSEVEEQHARFCLAMRQLFDAHKKDYVAMGADSSWLKKTLRLENE